jgi:hypothetical protein
MNGHQVVRFAPRRRETLFQEMIERVQLFEFPILFGAHFAEIFPKLDEADVPLRFFCHFPGQDLVDLA